MSRAHRNYGLLAVVVVALVAAGSILAWVQNNPKDISGAPDIDFHQADGTITFRLEQDGTSRITDGSDLQAIRNSFASINDIPTSIAAASEGTLFNLFSPVDVTDGLGNDGQNQIYFFDSDVDNQFPSGALGFAAVFIDASTGEIVDCDIVLNDINVTWSTFTPLDPNQPLGVDVIDLEETTSHEIMHCFGFGHSPIAGPFDPASGLQIDGDTSGDYSLQATAFPFVTGTIQGRTFEPDDVSAFSTVYPSASAGTSFGEISGKVIVPDGLEVKGAHVVAVLETDPDVPIVGALSGVGSALVPGGYRLTDLPPGNYFVRIEPLVGTTNSFTEHDSIFSGFEIGFPPEFYSGFDESEFDIDIAADDAAVVPVMAGVITPDIDITINTDPTSPPQNDGFVGTAIRTAPFTDVVDTRSATTAVGDPVPSCGANSRERSVWYNFVPPVSSTVEIDTFGSDYDTLLSVWTGSLDFLIEVACNDDASGLQSRISFEAAPQSTEYFFMISAPQSDGGMLIFNLTVDAPLLTFSPERLDFETRPVGTVSEPQNAVMTNSGSQPLRLDDITVSTSNWDLTHDCPPLLDSTENCTLSVSFAPKIGPAFMNGHVRISHNGPYSPNFYRLFGVSVPAFSLSPDPKEAKVLRGTESTSFMISASSEVGFTDSINLECRTSPGFECQLNPTSITADESSILTVSNLPNDQTIGSTSIVVEGTTGSQRVSFSVAVIFTDIQLRVSPDTNSISPGETAVYTLEVIPSFFEGNVSLGCTGAPERATCTITPATVTLNGVNLGKAEIRVTMTAPSTALMPTNSPSRWFLELLWIVALTGLAASARWTSKGNPHEFGIVTTLNLSRRVELIRARQVGLAIILAVVLTATSCGGGGSTFSFPPAQPISTIPGTPTSTHVLTITGTAQGQNRTTKVNLVVN